MHRLAPVLTMYSVGVYWWLFLFSINIDESFQDCRIPPPPPHGKLVTHEADCPPGDVPPSRACRGVPGAVVQEDWLLFIQCDPGYVPDDESKSEIPMVCYAATWAPTLPECVKSNTTTPATDPPSDSDSPGCVVPQDLRHRVMCSYQCDGCNPYNSNCVLPPMAQVRSGQVLRVQCELGHRLAEDRDHTAVLCNSGSWSPDLPECLKLCPPLESDSVYTRCQYRNSQVNCSSPMLPSTTAVYHCKPSHSEYPSLTLAGVYKRTITCKHNGKWSYALPECQPECGVSKGDAIVFPTIVDGKDARLGVFPWHVGLYKRDCSEDGEDNWKNICGGSLISNRIVMTAAHCVVTLSENDLKVGLGKYYRSWTQDDKYAVKRNVSAIRIPTEYNGAVTTYSWDIALLLLSQKVQINSFVMPVCRDVNLVYDITQNTTGYVVGWGKTISGGNESETLLFNNLSIIDHSTCITKIPRILAFDKFCGSKGAVSVAERGDSGGGLTAQFSGLHYIFGIVSLKHNDLTIFTNLSWSTHKMWIEKEISSLIDFGSLLWK